MMHSVHLPFQRSNVYRLHINYHMTKKNQDNSFNFRFQIGNDRQSKRLLANLGRNLLFHYYFFFLMDLQLTMQSVPITTLVVSSNHNHGDAYSIHHYVIASDLRQIGGFSGFSGFLHQ